MALPPRDARGRFIKTEPAAGPAPAPADLAVWERELGAVDLPAEDLRPLITAGKITAAVVLVLLLAVVVTALTLG